MYFNSQEYHAKLKYLEIQLKVNEDKREQLKKQLSAVRVKSHRLKKSIHDLCQLNLDLEEYESCEDVDSN